MGENLKYILSKRGTCGPKTQENMLTLVLTEGKENENPSELPLLTLPNATVIQTENQVLTRCEIASVPALLWGCYVQPSRKEFGRFYLYEHPLRHVSPNPSSQYEHKINKHPSSHKDVYPSVHHRSIFLSQPQPGRDPDVH